MFRSSFKWSRCHTDSHQTHTPLSLWRTGASCSLPAPALSPNTLPAVADGNVLRNAIQKQTSQPGKLALETEDDDVSFLSFSPEPQWQLQLRDMCKMSFKKSATGKRKYSRAAVLFSENCSIRIDMLTGTGTLSSTDHELAKSVHHSKPASETSQKDLTPFSSSLTLIKEKRQPGDY